MLRTYDDLPPVLQEVLANIATVIEALDTYNNNPAPSKQMNVDVQLSGLEIRMHNIAKEIRERLL
jgi:hypothetical protein